MCVKSFNQSYSHTQHWHQKVGLGLRGSGHTNSTKHATSGQHDLSHSSTVSMARLLFFHFQEFFIVIFLFKQQSQSALSEWFDTNLSPEHVSNTTTIGQLVSLIVYQHMALDNIKNSLT